MALLLQLQLVCLWNGPPLTTSACMFVKWPSSHNFSLYVCEMALLLQLQLVCLWNGPPITTSACIFVNLTISTCMFVKWPSSYNFSLYVCEMALLLQLQLVCLWNGPPLTTSACMFVKWPFSYNFSLYVCEMVLLLQLQLVYLWILQFQLVCLWNGPPLTTLAYKCLWNGPPITTSACLWNGPPLTTKSSERIFREPVRDADIQVNNVNNNRITTQRPHGDRGSMWQAISLPCQERQSSANRNLLIMKRWISHADLCPPCGRHVFSIFYRGGREVHRDLLGVTRSWLSVSQCEKQEKRSS